MTGVQCSKYVLTIGPKAEFDVIGVHLGPKLESATALS